MRAIGRHRALRQGGSVVTAWAGSVTLLAILVTVVSVLARVGNIH